MTDVGAPRPIEGGLLESTALGAHMRARPWIAPIAVGLGTLAATTYTAILNPNTSHAFPLCPLKLVTGYDCPLCGGLRAVHSLTHGDIIGAADHNVVVVAALPFVVVAYFAWLGRTLGLRIPRVTISPRLSWAFFVLLVVFGITRNITGMPGYAFLNSTAHLAGRSA
jgi:hypothetical protein